MVKKSLSVSITSKLSIIFAAILIANARLDDSSNNYLPFGSYCGPTNSIGQPSPCDYKSLLECNIHGICRCLEPRIMLYNGTSCAVLAGFSCKPTPKVWALDNVTTYQSDDFLFPCVSNADCSLEDYSCQCTSDFFQSSEHICKLKLHGTLCTSDSDCGSEETHLICTPQKKCGCNTKLSIFYGSRLCRSKAGAPCDTSGKLCGPNAECLGEFQNTRECRCNKGFSKSSDGRCLIAYNSECTMEPGKQCNEKEENTICIEGRCDCRSGQVWDESLKKCKHQLYTRCNNTLDCAEGMHCEGENGKRCLCNEGLYPVDYNCHPIFGQPCDYKPWDKTDNRKPSRACNPLASTLQCVKGICQCQNLEHYDHVTHQCRGLVDALCDLEMDDGKYCTNNSECVRPENYRVAEKGMCKCKEGWKPNSMNHCIPNL
ncbi:unnamed protein product [Orchesella dallaii]|uniref:EGF-like domain-containing protein n=1 Tax=Orchesella dallaii TaxID=48710 RepID=A0ABP1PWN7_9HEXA